MRVRSLVLLPAAIFTCTAALALAARAAEPVLPIGPGQTTWARHLVDTALAAHPGVAAIAVRATQLNAPDKVIVAVNAAGDRLEVEEPLKDGSGETIGALGVVFRYVKGQDNTAAVRVATEIQAFFGKHVLSEANLMDPYPYSAEYTPDNAAQALVDATMARHPELIVLGMHVTLPDGRGNVMLGANIGRIGKKADEDDMRVVNTEVSNFEVASNGKRYEVELVLRDATGRNIGALGTVFRYTAGDDKAALNARAIAIRDEMARAIPRVAALLERAPRTTAAGPRARSKVRRLLRRGRHVGCREDQLERYVVGAVDEDLAVADAGDRRFVDRDAERTQALDRLAVAAAAEGDVIDDAFLPALRGVALRRVERVRHFLVARVADVHDGRTVAVEPMPG
jgi:hypothetical protein